jgi:hypothetical protein
MPTFTTSFTSRDYTAIFEWLLNILREECPEITDYNYSEPAQALVRLIARATDSMSLYVDEAFAESFIHSAKFKQSLIDIARSVDLLPKLPNAAVATVRLTRKGIYIGNVGETGVISIPAGARVYKADGTGYVITTDVTMQVSDAYKDITVVQGERITRTLTISDFTLDQKTGRYYYNMGSGVAANSVTFVENSLISWEEVESLYRSFSDDEHFALEVYADLYNGISDTVFFTIGNDTVGKSLVSGTSYELSYIKCDGAAGNTGSGTITIIDETYNYLVTIANTTSATGGAGVENIEDFRARIPRVVRTQRRAVTKEDYEALVLSIPGVKRCECIDRNDVDRWPHLYVVIYVVPEGGGAMSTTLYNTIMAQLTSIACLGGWEGRYILLDAEEVPVDIICSIGINYGYSSEAVISSVTTAINSYFHVDNNDVHMVFSLGSLHTTIMAVTGVSWVEFNDAVVNVYPDHGQITTVGTITITVAT